jgi:hypothetical protein
MDFFEGTKEISSMRVFMRQLLVLLCVISSVTILYGLRYKTSYGIQKSVREQEPM